MTAEQLKADMEKQLDHVKEFIKTAFAVDGTVTTTGKECIIIQPDGSQSKGVSFEANDQERGTFIVTLSNPEPFEQDEKTEQA